MCAVHPQREKEFNCLTCKVYYCGDQECFDDHPFEGHNVQILNADKRSAFNETDKI